MSFSGGDQPFHTELFFCTWGLIGLYDGSPWDIWVLDQ